MYRVLKRIEALRVRVGGQTHSGWLPCGVAIPPATPTEEVLLNLTIASDGHGYMLEWHGEDNRHSGDTWHQSMDEALHQAQFQFGIEPTSWREP